MQVLWTHIAASKGQPINRYSKRTIMNARQRISIGSTLTVIACAGIVLSGILGWTSLVRTRGFLLGLVLGVIEGVGVILAMMGFIEYKRSK